MPLDIIWEKVNFKRKNTPFFQHDKFFLQGKFSWLNSRGWENEKFPGKSKTNQKKLHLVGEKENILGFLCNY